MPNRTPPDLTFPEKWLAWQEMQAFLDDIPEIEWFLWEHAYTLSAPDKVLLEK